MTSDYVAAMRTAFVSLADPERATHMQAYMRGQFEFLGIPTPIRRQAISGLGPVRFGAAETLAIAEALWRLPQREYRYAAVDLLARRAKHMSISDLPRLLALARRDAWWDTVDALAGVVGDVMRAARKIDPKSQLTMDAALLHDDLWIRRIAMLHQLGWRLDTDQTRLFDYARTLAPESDFFIRKAIGWALRDYARWNPEAVRGFIASMGDCLSPLSAREAGKHL